MAIPEPFSVLATSLGVTATALNFLLSTIVSLEQKHHQFSHIDDEKLLKSHQELSDAEYIFQRWLDTWARHSLEDQHYEDHFGRNEWKDIKSRGHRVKERICKLREDLYLAVQPETPETPALVQQPDDPLGSYKHIKKRLHHVISAALNRTGKGADSINTTDFSTPNSQHTTIPSLDIEEYAVWRNYVRSDPSPQLITPSVSLGYKIIAILSAKWERIDRSTSYLNHELGRLITITSVYRDRRLGEPDEVSRRLADDARRFDFSILAKYILKEIVKLQEGLPRLGWHLQVSDFQGWEQASESWAKAEPQGVLKKIVADCRFLFATHTTNDSDIFTRSLELKAARGTMIPKDPLWKTLKDLGSEDDFQRLSRDDDWKCFIRIEDFPGKQVFRLKTSADQRIRLWTKDWQKLLVEGMGNDLTRKIFTVERARLIYGLTTWMILLWGEDWFSHVCTCRLRCVFFGETENNDPTWHGIGTNAPFVLPSLQHVYSLGLLDRESRSCVVNSCDDAAVKPSAENKLQFFAILLAEILLARKIEIDQSGRPAGNDSENSEDELVEAVERGIAPLMASVLQFCFERASGDIMWNGMQRSEQQKELTEHVLKPAKEYYKIVSRRPENRKWAEKLQGEVFRHEDASFKV